MNEFSRTWCGKNGIDHEIVCQRCLSNSWKGTDDRYPICANCNWVDQVNHKTCLDGKCTNAMERTS